MENPRWKPNRILNSVCYKLLVPYWKLMFKYKYHSDYVAMYLADKKPSKGINDKVSLDNITYGGKYDRRKMD